MRLRASGTDSWDEFVLAMREYAAASTTEMLRAPPEALAKAQGMALAVNEIATTLMNAPKLHEKMRNNG